MPPMTTNHAEYESHAKHIDAKIDERDSKMFRAAAAERLIAAAAAVVLGLWLCPFASFVVPFLMPP